MMPQKETVSSAATSETAKTKEMKDKGDNTTGERKRGEVICWPDRKPQNDWTGRKQGLLEFVHPVAWRNNCHGGCWMYLCECECGQEAIIAARKATQSCGCLKRQASAIATAAWKRQKMMAAAKASEKAAKASRQALRSGATRPNGPLNPFDCVHKGYRCDKWAEGTRALKRKCYGDRCYVNERLCIGIF